MKKNTAKIATPLSAVAAMFALGAAGAHAQTTPVFDYDFPASWNGTGTAVTDQSTAGNNGTTLGSPTLTTTVPSGAADGTESITGGGIITSGTSLLNNTAVAAAGGFTYDVSFLWNGTDASNFGHTEKIIDYTGTESLQLVTTAGSATLEMEYADDSGNETVANTMTIAPNTWYSVMLTFNTAGNSLGGSGDISGLSSLYVDGSFVDSAAATKGTYGDDLNRAIGVGNWADGNYGSLIGLNGDIYDASVDLGTPVPEPSATALLGMSGALAMAWNLRRRKT